jgi:hypothetical protein
MVNSGTGHDRCPSGFPEPIRRPGATLRWRLRNYKTRFWFQGGVKIFCPDLDRPAGGPPGGQGGALTMFPLRRELFAGPAHGEVQLLRLLLPTGVLGCERFSNAARSGSTA